MGAQSGKPALGTSRSQQSVLAVPGAWWGRQAAQFESLFFYLCLVQDVPGTCPCYTHCCTAARCVHLHRVTMECRAMGGRNQGPQP